MLTKPILKRTGLLAWIAAFGIPIMTACLWDSSAQTDAARKDGARQVMIHLDGSLQNPAWSPDSGSLLFTKFGGGYNAEPADIFVIELEPGVVKPLVSDGSGNVNLPGSSWNPFTGQVVFSSSREPHDEIYLINGNGKPGDEIQITSRADRVSYEPSLSPDGQWVVFESHVLDVEDNGIIVKYKLDGSEGYQTLTGDDEDCRQPNWSPDGERILYQKYGDGQWDIWTMRYDGTDHRKITSGTGDKTDASFSPEGDWIVFSGSQPGFDFANLFITPSSGGAALQLTRYEGYDGAPSWSYDGEWIAFESYPGDPDDSPGTTLWIIEVPEIFR